MFSLLEQHRFRFRRTFIASFTFVIVGLATACTSLLPPSISTPLPTEFLPTAAALTLAASGVLTPTIPSTTNPTSMLISTPDSTSEPSSPPGFIPSTVPPVRQEPIASQVISAIVPALAITEATPIRTLTPTVLPPTPSPIGPTAFPPALDPALGTPTFTVAPPIPEARIQIQRLGELSKLISPMDVSARLTCGEGKVVRIEMYGEDGRLLARYVRTYNSVPWNTARIGFRMDFEISSAAELGRLVISAEDSLGRLIEVNSMDLVLLSQGMSEINPPSGLQQRIIIQDPADKALIQNGRLIVSGRARPASNQPLRAMLVGEDGKVLGQRLAGITFPIPGDYGPFIAEVPYAVSGITPALLVVFEEGGQMSEYTYLTSIHVTLAP